MILSGAKSLLHRVILSTSNPGDVVLDPFFGTGTTGAVAKKLGRHFIGFEMEEEYIHHAQKRIDKITKGTGENIQVTASRRAAPRVPFGRVIEEGFLTPGMFLFNKTGHVSAKVRPDGSLLVGDFSGSIHQVGARVQNAPSCNGWTYWHYHSTEGLTPIDAIRDEIRATMEGKLRPAPVA